MKSMKHAARYIDNSTTSTPTRTLSDEEVRELGRSLTSASDDGLTSILDLLVNELARRQPEEHLFGFRDGFLDDRYGLWSLCGRVWTPNFELDTSTPGEA